ncbi:MAG: cyclic nucleotide-binding domain-containing protein [Actinobacteria bacterium]|nr:MAG: cyclic nucleotide-binding domain-containing protein [Actinomycetota bacterium]
MSQPLGTGVEEPANRHGAFPRLDDEQRAVFREAGEVRAVQPGDVLFQEGDAGYDFFVVESGAVAIVQGYGHENRVIAVHGPHRFLGELGVLTGSPAYLSAVVRDAGEVIQLSPAGLRTIVTEDEELSNLILQAFIARRARLIDLGAGVKVVGSRYSRDTQRLREFLARNRMPHQWMDLEDDEEAETLLQVLGVAASETPVVIGGHGVMRNPSNAEVAELLGLGSRGAPPALCDLVIVGGGPAGLAAALYGASEGLDTQAIDAVAFGGQAGTSSRIENYLGFPTGISGSELAERAGLQARRLGARLVVPAEAVGLSSDNGHYSVQLSSGDVVNGRTLIVATGAQYRKPDLPELERYEGVGVYYAATQAEAQRCAADPVLIVGGGNSAGQAALFLSQHASSCRLIIRGGDLGKSMSRYLVDEIERLERVEVLTQREIVELRGESALEAVVVADTSTGEREELEAKALFVFIGAVPHTDWLRGHVAMDEHCFLLTGRDIQGEDLAAYGEELPFFLETSRPGIFAVGDVHSGSVKRVASAVGEGSMAVRLVHQRLATR